MKRILIIMGHPRTDSLCQALVDAYAAEARQAGGEVRVLALAELTFDPILHGGYRGQQPLEPGLLAAQEAVRWAELLVLAFPIWWGDAPALLKGFIDRVFLPGFAFQYREGASLPDQLLKGKQARLLVTMDSPSWWYRWWVGAPVEKSLVRATLNFCGISKVKRTWFCQVRTSTPEQRAGWIQQAGKVGQEDGQRVA